MFQHHIFGWKDEFDRTIVFDIENAMNKTETLLEQDNVISLRTALVQDDGDVVAFRLMPGWLGSSIPGIHKPRDFDWTSQDYAWLYRRMRSASDEVKLMRGSPCMEQDIRPLIFEKLPEFKLLWTDSGNSVALYLNGEPWAFIEEKTRKGYSKGILKPATVNLWDQELFGKVFLAK